VSKKIGFIGLGNMGLRIVELLLEDGFDVVVWARRPQSIAPLQGRVTVADSPAQLGSTVSLVGVCVWDEHDVEEVLLGNTGVFGGLASGGIVMIHSTIAPGACSRLAEQAAEIGVAVLDVPVSVGPNAPKVLALVGGDSEVVEKARPALRAFSEPAVHLGPLGSGQIAKLMNNTMQAATVGIGFEAVDAGVGLGLDRDARSWEPYRLRPREVPGRGYFVADGTPLMSQLAKDARTNGRPKTWGSLRVSSKSGSTPRRPVFFGPPNSVHQSCRRG